MKLPDHLKLSEELRVSGRRGGELHLSLPPLRISRTNQLLVLQSVTEVKVCVIYISVVYYSVISLLRQEIIINAVSIQEKSFTEIYPDISLITSLHYH